MASVNQTEFINDFYKNKKNDPAKPFLLANSAWENLIFAKFKSDMLRFVSRSISIILVIFALGLMKSLEDSIKYIIPTFLQAIIAIASFVYLLAEVIIFLYKNDKVFDEVNYIKNGIPKNFIYSLRSWLNSKYDMNLSDAQVVSLLVKPRTTLDDNRYRLVYSDDGGSIVQMIVDNSCPSDCCDKTNTDDVPLNMTNDKVNVTI